MKYLIIVFGLIVTTLVMSIMLLPKDKEMQHEEIAVTINGRNISNATLADEGSGYGFHGSRLELFESIITRELLIQEAQRLEIDKEESFRKALKRFYENSLVKILLERKNKDTSVSVSEQEIDTYISFLGRNVSFTRLHEIPVDPALATAAQGIENTALFDDLAEPLRLLLATLKPGEYAVRFDTGNEKYAIRLDSISQRVQKAAAQDRNQLEENLKDYKREQLLRQWLTDLKSHATITIHQN